MQSVQLNGSLRPSVGVSSTSDIPRQPGAFDPGYSQTAYTVGAGSAACSTGSARPSGGGPMRSQPPYGNRGRPGGYSRDPYPPPPQPSYMRERMDSYGGGYDSRGRDSYARGSEPMDGGGAGPMYDRRGGPAAYPEAGPTGGRGDMGGPGPMRGPDPYES